MKTELVELTQEYVDKMKGHLRHEDHIECLACAGHDADEALQWAFEHSAPDLNWAILVDGEPVMGVGCCPSLRSPFRGVVWMLGTDRFILAKDFLKENHKKYLTRMLEGFDVLEALVHAENERAVRYIKRCGFSVTEKAPHGINCEMFYYVYLLRGGLDV